MLPAVIRPEPPLTGGETARSSLCPLAYVQRVAFPEWDRCAPVVAGNPSPSPISFEEDADAEFDDLQVPAAVADVELCMCPEPMSLQWTRTDGHVDPAGEHIDGSVGR
jgi:hypothetical protein